MQFEPTVLPYTSTATHMYVLIITIQWAGGSAQKESPNQYMIIKINYSQALPNLTEQLQMSLNTLEQPNPAYFYVQDLLPIFISLPSLFDISQKMYFAFILYC